VFLKVKSKRISFKLGSFLKLEIRYCGSFEVFENIGLVEYMIELLVSMRIYNVFHVSLLKKYVHDPNHVIDWNVIQVENEGDFWVEPVRIVDRKVKVIRNKSIGLVKVKWTYYSPKDTTWEQEKSMREAYL